MLLRLHYNLDSWILCPSSSEIEVELTFLSLLNPSLQTADKSDDRGKDSSLPVSTSSVSPLPLPPEQLDAAVELLTTSIK